MPTIKNMSYGPITITVGSETRTIEYGRSIEVDDDADLDTDEIRKLLAENKIGVKKDKPHDKSQVSQGF
jgi:hypothetical protein